ncbi:MAG TPA: hypothetical protein VGI17_12785 [Solirubrobacterales bacterium]
MPADLEKLAYEFALRALDKQERLVEELRARAGVVLAASSLAVSFLGGRGLAGPGPVGLALLSIFCFVVSVGAAIFLLLPKPGLAFTATAASVLDGLSAFRGDPAELYRRAGNNLDRVWAANDAAIRRLSAAFAIALCALGVEVVALAALLGGTLI